MNGELGAEASRQNEWTAPVVAEVSKNVERAGFEALTMDELPGALGYEEDLEQKSLRADWTEAVRAEMTVEVMREKALAYQERAEAAETEHLARFRQGRAGVQAWVTGDERAE